MKHHAGEELERSAKLLHRPVARAHDQARKIGIMQSQVFLFVDMQRNSGKSLHPAALTFGAGLSSAAGVRTQLTALASLGAKTSMSFFRHEEIYRSDVSPGYSWERQLNVAAPVLIGCDEFPVGYSLAGCPPAEPASASPTSDDSQQSTNQQQQQNQEQQQNQNQEQNQGRLHRRLDTSFL
jgi:hypothetical protein